jgi:catechol 2,3-dioxygenase-like lactoylglutathione lyase family enzyme/tetratricopeptide (TPR) repeat protein
VTTMTTAAANRLDTVLRTVPERVVGLAYHAALPVAVDTHLLHLLRVNFLDDLPYEVEAELLLSPLFRESDDGLFEIEPDLRALLLVGLRTHFGEAQVRRVALLLEQYGKRTGAWTRHPELDYAQRLTALHVIDPARADAWLASGTASSAEPAFGRAWFVAMRDRLDSQPPAHATLDAELGAAVDKLRGTAPDECAPAVRAVAALASLPGADPAPAIAALREVAGDPTGLGHRHASEALRRLDSGERSTPEPVAAPDPAAADGDRERLVASILAEVFADGDDPYGLQPHVSAMLEWVGGNRTGVLVLVIAGHGYNDGVSHILYRLVWAFDSVGEADVTRPVYFGAVRLESGSNDVPLFSVTGPADHPDSGPVNLDDMVTLTRVPVPPVFVLALDSAVTPALRDVIDRLGRLAVLVVCTTAEAAAALPADEVIGLGPAARREGIEGFIRRHLERQKIHDEAIVRRLSNPAVASTFRAATAVVDGYLRLVQADTLTPALAREVVDDVLAEQPEMDASTEPGLDRILRADRAVDIAEALLGPDPHMAERLRTLAEVYQAAGWTARAQDAHRRADEIDPPVRPEPPARAAVHGSDDSVSFQHAAELHWQGKLRESERAYRQIISDRTRALGPEHPDTLTARDQYATVLRDMDRLGEAVSECEAVLAARIRTLGHDHPDTLTSRSHLATIHHQLGELIQAEAEHEQVLQARTRVFGAIHQETLISRSNLAKVHQDLGEVERAVDEHRQVLDARTRLLGPEHRDTLMSRSLLASALHQAGRLEEAEVQHRRVLRERVRLLGPVHLDTAVSRHRLASVLHDVGRLGEAIAEYRVAYDIYAELLGAASPFARAAKSDLAIAERALAEARRPSPRRPSPQRQPLPDEVGDAAILGTPVVGSSQVAAGGGVSVTLFVADVDRAVAFYRDVLGLSAVETGRASAVLARGDARILLRHVADLNFVDRRIVHLNLEVQDVKAAYDELRAKGVEFVHKPRVVSRGEQLELWAATFRDPDGHAIAVTRWEPRQP